MDEKKIGVIACCGEECLGGTLTRMATRRVLEDLRADNAVTICLPLFIAGGEEERSFARNNPVIAVDGCHKQCAKWATEKYSGPTVDHIDLADVFGEESVHAPIVSQRQIGVEQQNMAAKAANVICTAIDKQLGK